ncbi:MAG: tetratricopeptide repeat protein, partial [Candidatus Zixiibacteriota bacterium]
LSAKMDVNQVTSSLKAADTAGAQSAIEAALTSDSDDFVALFWQGRIHYARGNWQAASESFTASLDAKDKHYPSLYYLTLSQMHLGQFKEAASNLRKGSKKARTMRIEFRGAEDTLRLLKAEFAKGGSAAGPNGSNAGASDETPQQREARLKEALRENPQEALNHFALGKFYYDQGNYDDAHQRLEEALKKKRGHELSTYFLGLTKLKMGKLNKARKLFLKALGRAVMMKAEFNSGLGLVALEEARELEEEEASQQEIFAKASEADGYFRAAMATNSDDCKFHLYLAEANYIRGVFASAKAEYETALSMCPGSARVLINYAQACYNMKDFGCALEQAGKVIEQDSANAKAWRMVGSINYGAAVAARSSDDAVAKYKNSIAAYRRYQDLAGAVADSSNVQVFYEIATALSRLGGHEEALKNYHQVLALDVAPKDIFYAMAKAHTGLQKWDEAITYLQKHRAWVADQDDDYRPIATDVELDRRFGEAYYNKKEYVSALPYLTRSFNADTTQQRLLLNISLSYHNLKDYAHALPYYQKALAIDLGEQAWSIYLNAAYCALALANGDDDDEMDEEDEEMDEEAIDAIPVTSLNEMAPSDYYELAVKWLAKALEFKPDHDKAINLMATTYLYDLNDCANGVAWYKKVNERNPDDCEALRSLGYAYFGGVCDDNYGRAIGYLGQALDCMGGDPCGSTEISLWIAQAYHMGAVDKTEQKQKAEAKKDFKKAFDWYKKVLACDPANTDAKEGKSQVQFEF